MQSVSRRRRRGVAAATHVLIALSVFGMLLMHSVTPVPTVGSEHAAMASVSHHEDSMQGAVAEPDCPSTHQMMHPCAGTTVSWPALSVPSTGSVVDVSITTPDDIGGRAQFTSERAPPWTLWELDRSVTLRV
ncbi:MAG: DUF6153 family protein [Rhodococcus sp. (in: high G+C Gram-positive bacteria)]